MSKQRLLPESIRQIWTKPSHLFSRRVQPTAKPQPLPPDSANYGKSRSEQPPQSQEQQRLPTVSMQLDAKFPAQVKMLVFEKSQSDPCNQSDPCKKYHMYCFTKGESTELDIEVSCPALRFSEFDYKSPWLFIFDSKRISSQGNEKFINWLKRNLLDYGKDFVLIVYNESNCHDLAWELIHIDLSRAESQQMGIDLDGEVPIGALAKIVHWGSALDYYKKSNLTIAPSIAKGSIVAYVDQSMEQDKQALKHFHHHACDDLVSVEERLMQPLADVGLVYLACHGVFQLDPSSRLEQYLKETPHPDGKREVNQRRLSYETLFNLEALDWASRPVVIVNACFSSLCFSEAENHLVGLPVGFLQRIARAYIGCLNAVGKDRAKVIWEKLTNAVLVNADQGALLTDVLRDLRLEAFRSLRNWHRPHVRDTEPGKDAALDFIDTFMYVYFGNPLERLQLTPSTPPDQPGDLL